MKWKYILALFVGLLTVGITLESTSAQINIASRLVYNLQELDIIHETNALIVQDIYALKQKNLILNKIKAGYPVIIIGKNAETKLYTILLERDFRRLKEKEIATLVNEKTKELGFSFSVPISKVEESEFQEVIAWKTGKALHVSVISVPLKQLNNNVNRWMVLKTKAKLESYKKVKFSSTSSGSGWSTLDEYDKATLLPPYGEIYYEVTIKGTIGNDGYQYVSYRLTHESTPGQAYWSNDWKNEKYITYLKLNAYSSPNPIYDEVFKLKKYEPHATVTNKNVEVSFSVPPAGTLSWGYDTPSVTASVVLSRSAKWVEFTHDIHGGYPSTGTYTAEPGVLWRVHPEATGIYYKIRFTWKFKKDNHLWPDDHYTKTITKYRYVGMP